MLTFQILKKTLYTELPKILFPVLSISTAHYVGFIENLPPQVAILGGTAFAASVTSTFLFYAGCCFVIARIFAHGFVGGFLPAEIFIDRLAIEGKTTLQRRRKSLSMYRDALSRLDKRIPVAQFIAFVGFFIFSYLRPPIETPSPAILLFLAFSVFSTLAWLDFFLVWPHKYPRRIRKKWKSPQMAIIKNRLLIGGLVLLNIGAYVSGQARIQHILELRPVNIESPNFNGKAQVIANIGELYLLRVNDDEALFEETRNSFVYLDGKNVIEIPGSFITILPPIK